MSVFPAKYVVGPWSFQMFRWKNGQGARETLSPDAVPQREPWRDRSPKGRKQALAWALQRCSLLRLSPFCTGTCQSPEQGIHMSPGTHFNLHNEHGIPALKQQNLSFSVPPSIPVVIKAIDKHHWLFSVTLRANAVSHFTSLITERPWWMVMGNTLSSEKLFVVIAEDLYLSPKGSWRWEEASHQCS